MDILDSLRDFFSNTVVQVALTLFIALAVHTLVGMSIGQLVRRIVRRHKFSSEVEEEKRENTLISIFRTAAAVVIWTITIVVVLTQLHVNLAALVTGAGVVGVVVGFGAQSTIKDFLAGFFVIVENQYRVGDIVSLRAGGDIYSGVVEDITVRITRLRDLDGNLHIIPNGSVVVTTNRTFEYANVNIDVCVAYESDIDKVERVMNKVGDGLQEDTDWAEKIFEPIHFLRVDGFEDSGVRIKALGQVEPAMQWDVAGEFRRRLIAAFEKAGIAIPLPQVVVHTSRQ